MRQPPRDITSPVGGSMSKSEPGTLSPRKFLSHPAFLTLPALAILLLVMAVPLGTVISRSFTEGDALLDNYIWFFNTPVNITVLIRTFRIAAVVTLVCVLVAYPYAYAMSVAGPRLRLILIMCVLVPFWVSGVVRTLAWVILLQDSGVINKTLVAFGFDKVKLIRTQLGVTIGMT